MSADRRTDAVVQEIEIAASAERVFAALTDPVQRVRWWGLKGRYGATGMESDLRPGGAWSMVGHRGEAPFAVRGVYREVVPPRLLEFTWDPDWPGQSETVVRIELHERGEATLVRLTHSGFDSEEHRAFYRGWSQLLHALRDHVVSAGGAASP